MTQGNSVRNAALVAGVALMLARSVDLAMPRGLPPPQPSAPCSAPHVDRVGALTVSTVQCAPGDNWEPAPGPLRLLAGMRLDPNTATQSDLESIPGIGPATARSLIQDREHNGAFTSVDALQRVKGIGPKTVEKLRAYMEIPATQTP